MALRILVLCLAATAVLAQTDVSTPAQTVHATPDTPDRATAHIGMVSQWEIKLQEQQRKDEVNFANVKASCAQFVAPYEEKMKEAEQSLENIEKKLKIAEEVKAQSVVPEGLVDNLAKSKKTTDTLESILEMVDKVKHFGSTQASAFNKILADGQEYLQPLVDAESKYTVTSAFLEVAGMVDQRHRRHHGKKHHNRLRKGVDVAAAAAATGVDKVGMLSTDDLERKVVSSFHDLTNAIQNTDETADWTSRAYEDHVPSLRLKLEEHKKALEQGAEVKAKIQKALDEAKKRIGWLKDAEVEAKKFAENASMKYEEIVAVCKAYDNDYEERSKKRSNLLEKARQYVSLTSELHSRLIPSIQAPVLEKKQK